MPYFIPFLIYSPYYLNFGAHELVNSFHNKPNAESGLNLSLILITRVRSLSVFCVIFFVYKFEIKIFFWILQYLKLCSFS